MEKRNSGWSLEAKLIGFGVRAVLIVFAQVTFAIESPEEIRALYAETNKLIEHKKASELLLHTGPGDYGPGPNSNAKEKWYLAEPHGDPKPFDGSDYKARAYVHDGRLIKAVILSISEGWNNAAEYYFYKDGKTAFVFERLVTEHGYNTDKQEPLTQGPYVVEWRTYFDRSGNVVRELKKGFYESNKQELPLKYIRTSVMTYGYYYKNSTSLPFSSVIKMR